MVISKRKKKKELIKLALLVVHTNKLFYKYLKSNGMDRHRNKLNKAASTRVGKKTERKKERKTLQIQMIRSLYKGG